MSTSAFQYMLWLFVTPMIIVYHASEQQSPKTAYWLAKYQSVAVAKLVVKNLAGS